MMRRRVLVQMMAVGFTCVAVTAAFAGDTKPTPDEVKTLTLRATQMVEDKGIESARSTFNQDGEFKYGEIYVGVMDSKGTWVVYPPKPEAVGKVIYNLQDADGKFLVQAMLKTADDNKEGGWVEYHWKNPVTNTIQLKQTFIKRASGTDYVVYIGIYK
jgi:cytochrome c